MGRLLVSLGAGIVFGFGLGLSQMVNPAKVIGFLDVAGNWDPSLAFVMAGALAVTFVVFRPALKRPQPVMAAKFFVPTAGDIDARLVGGSAIFGIGWGLVGFCPGPALSSLAYGLQDSLIFVAALVVGAGLAKLVPPGKTRKEPAAA